MITQTNGQDPADELRRQLAAERVRAASLAQFVAQGVLFECLRHYMAHQVAAFESSLARIFDFPDRQDPERLRRSLEMRIATNHGMLHLYRWIVYSGKRETVPLDECLSTIAFADQYPTHCHLILPRPTITVSISPPEATHHAVYPRLLLPIAKLAVLECNTSTVTLEVCDKPSQFLFELTLTPTANAIGPDPYGQDLLDWGWAPRLPPVLNSIVPSLGGQISSPYSSLTPLTIVLPRHYVVADEK